MFGSTVSRDVVSMRGDDDTQTIRTEDRESSGQYQVSKESRLSPPEQDEKNIKRQKSASSLQRKNKKQKMISVFDEYE